MTSANKTPRRIYLVRSVDTGAERLIRAATVAQARNHAARDTLEVSVATQEQLVALLTGIENLAIEDASDHQTVAVLTNVNTVAVEDASERETEPITDDKQLSL